MFYFFLQCYFFGFFSSFVSSSHTVHLFSFFFLLAKVSFPFSSTATPLSKLRCNPPPPLSIFCLFILLSYSSSPSVRFFWFVFLLSLQRFVVRERVKKIIFSNNMQMIFIGFLYNNPFPCLRFVQLFY